MLSVIRLLSIDCQPIGETPAGNTAMSWEEIVLAYPSLAERIVFLSSIDKVVETDAKTIDLYSAVAIVLTLKYNEAGTALLVHSSTHSGFAADLAIKLVFIQLNALHRLYRSSQVG